LIFLCVIKIGIYIKKSYKSVKQVNDKGIKKKCQRFCIKWSNGLYQLEANPIRAISTDISKRCIVNGTFDKLSGAKINSAIRCNRIQIAVILT